VAALGYMLTIRIWMWVDPAAASVQPRVPWSGRIKALIAVWPVLSIFFLVVGGISLGWFTPNEAAAIGAAGTGIAALMSGNMTKELFLKAILATASATAMIYLIIYGAGLYNNFLSQTYLPQTASAWMGGQDFAPYMVLVCVLLMYLVFGCVMDSLSMILLTVPTPPVGMNLFIINKIAKDIPIVETYKGVLPFVASDLIRVVVLVLFPPITLALVWLLN